MSWIEVGHVNDMPVGLPKFVTVGKREIGVVTYQGSYYAVLNFCPHAGAPMCFGEIQQPVVSDGPGEPARRNMDSPVIRCPWHRWEFDLKTGQSLCPIREKIRTYPVEVREGVIWIDA